MPSQISRGFPKKASRGVVEPDDHQESPHHGIAKVRYIARVRGTITAEDQRVMEPTPARCHSSPISYVMAGGILALLYGEFRVLQLTVEWLNRIPNMSGSRHLEQLYLLGGGLVLLLAAVIICLHRYGESAMRKSGEFGGWALGGAFMLGGTCFPLCFLGELLCYSAAAVLSAALLRLPFCVRLDGQLARLLLLNVLPAAAAALGFGVLGLLIAKRIAMEIRID